MAPEIILLKPHIGAQVDVFSLGVVLFYMIYATKPFNDAKKADKKYQLIIAKQYESYWKSFPGLKDKNHEACRDLL